MKKLKEYKPQTIEKKWQKEWEKKKIYQARPASAKSKKFYGLMEFPYPSGEGLHTGHVRGYTAMDIISRKRRMEGRNVLFPIGWDAFGLPTENYAIKTGKQPAAITKKNTDNFRKQFKSLGMSFDWSREINTTDPKYYKWTQWIFLQMFKKGLAYKTKIEINWCPRCKIGLANEEVINGNCERCGTSVEKREKEQWMLAITKYADRLDKDLDLVDYLPKIKTQQRNWIGKSEGTLIKFPISNFQFPIEVFTTRADTLFGATYLVVAPEYEKMERWKEEKIIKNWEEIQNYIKEAKNKTEIDRTAENKEKTGVKLEGITAVNPATREEIPIFVADYVLGHYGTGAVMAVPAHDQRDFEFAKKYSLPIKQAVMPDQLDQKNPPREGKQNTERNVVHAILRNTKNKTVLIEFLKGEKWEGNEPRNFIIGGIEGGETEVEAAVREIREETGYTNVKFVEKIPVEIQARFFANHKDVNRKIRVHTLVFDLMGEERVEITEDEYFHKDSHELKWVPYEQVANTVSIQDDQLTWSYLSTGGFAVTDDGILVNSGDFNGLESAEAREEITKKFGKKVVKYKLRDWVFSRQRYWGEPIPLVKCDKCALRDPSGQGWVAVPEKDLPVKLPPVKKYQPTDMGESPLATIKSWVNTKCPKCKGPAKRETDTMPNWAGSSWYYLRYVDPKNNKVFADKKNLKYWLGVDWYNGGMEHTTLHLLYSRFWHKFLYDLKLVPTSEPYKKRTSHGMILAEGGEKMSKSKGNVINPDDIVKTWGADSLRLYEMFMGPFADAIAWNTDNMIGVRRFLERVWKLQFKIKNLKFKINSKLKIKNLKLESLLHKTVKKVTEDIEDMKFNTAISALMICANELDKEPELSKTAFGTFITLLAPFAPHIAEEIWASASWRIGGKKSVHLEKWPKYDAKKIVEEKVVIVIQINGKVRAQFEASSGIAQKEAEEKAFALPEIKKWSEGRNVKKTFFVADKIINIVLD